MSRDYYSEARGLARQLEGAGIQGAPEALLQAIESGSTATEILMKLRWTLAGIRTDHPRVSPAIDAALLDLETAISSALGPG